MPPRQRNSPKISRELWDQAGSSYGALARAILYELQPIRFSQLQIQQWATKTQNVFVSILSVTWSILQTIFVFIRDDFSLWHGKLLAAVLLYYCLVRVVHEYLEAGPLMLMVTALALIFTIGLADKNENDPRSQREMSAYHVFNRGMQRMMGDLDAEQMLAQHLGGVLYNGNNNNDDDDGFRARPQGQRLHEAGVQGNNNENVDNGNDALQQGAAARRSRKRARGEQRREMQRQREAAIAAIEDDDGEDAVALQRHLEEQILIQQQQH
jgi:hypothetical protein